MHNLEIKAVPQMPLPIFEDVPLLFGEPRIEKTNGQIIIYADIIASSFFLLSRYEEILKPEYRDQHGRFLAKYSGIFQKYGNRPLVDEYGRLLRKWIRESGIDVPLEKSGFSKIYLTHDVDMPFRFKNFTTAFKQCIKNILVKCNLINREYVKSPLKKYFTGYCDEYYTFPKIIEYDTLLKYKLSSIKIESIYFFISAGLETSKKYYNFFSRKIKKLLLYILQSNANAGIHLSYEAGSQAQRIDFEVRCFKKLVKTEFLLSRHHFLCWNESEQITYMEQSGITDDFTLCYADMPGFRVGTCRPYSFIHPRTKSLTNVIIHPLQIMECTLSREDYMNLDYDLAFAKCREIIAQVNKHNGELVLLWHNTEFLGKNYQERLYKNILEYIKDLVLYNDSKKTASPC